MIAVVGGGLSGLATGYFLMRAGADVAVLEASGRPGGVIESVAVEGRVLELGPQRARLAGPFQEIVTELGLEDQVVTAPDLPLYIWHDRALRQVPLDLRSAITTDLLDWSDRARLLLEPFTAGMRDDESAGDYFTRKLGREPYDRVIAPLFGGLYASDPADMPARHALAATLRRMGVRRSLLLAMLRGARRRRRSAAPACSFRGGLQVLTDTLAGALGDRLRLRSRVRGITAERTGRSRLTLDDDALAAEHVVLACPARVAGELLGDIAPDAAARLSRLRYNPLAVVHLICDAKLHGLGYQVPFAAGTATRGVTWNRAMFDRPGLYTAFLGGAHRPNVPAFPDDELGALAAKEFRQVTGEEARPIHVSRARMPAWDTSWDAMDGLHLPEGVSACASWAARPGLPGRLADARGVADTLAGRGSRTG